MGLCSVEHNLPRQPLFTIFVDAVCVLSVRFFFKFTGCLQNGPTLYFVKFKRHLIIAFWVMLILKFYWTRFLFYQSNFVQIRTWPSFHDNQASCRISLKSVENFLSYLNHRKTNKQTDRLTRVKQYLSPKQSLGRGN